MTDVEQPDRKALLLEQFTVDGRLCLAYAEPEAQCLAIQPVDEQDRKGLHKQLERIIEETRTPFALAAFQVLDWNQELSPWEAPPAFGKEGFGAGASGTLNWLESCLIPALSSRFGFPKDTPVILGGYSLAAFFSLWSAYQTDRFAAVAAASPSVWFPGWIEYAQTHSPLTDCVYLSLGDREERTRNKTMAAVGDCIRRQYDLLAGRNRVLEWNDGNHFKDADLRCARAFSWCINQLCEIGMED